MLICPLFHNIFNIALTLGVQLHVSFVKCGCSIYFFLNSANLIHRGTDISNYSESPLDQDNESRLYLSRYTVFLTRLQVRTAKSRSAYKSTHSVQYSKYTLLVAKNQKRFQANSGNFD